MIFDVFGKELWRDNTRANLTRANLTGADLADASLTGANLTRANLTRANLTRANLAGANLADANLTRADLTGANLTGANLTGANLTGANLTRANLARADLTRAYLTRANLADANLTRADLTRATGYNPWRTDSLRLLLMQPGNIRAYKMVDAGYLGPVYPLTKYLVGTTVTEEYCCSDERVACGAGINLATLPWILGNGMTARHRILIVEFKASDIVAIPRGTDGKFRVKRCKVLRELTAAEYAEYGVPR